MFLNVLVTKSVVFKSHIDCGSFSFMRASSGVHFLYVPVMNSDIKTCQ